MKKILFSFSLLSLFSTHAEAGTLYSFADAFFNFIGIPAKEFTSEEENLLNIIRNNTANSKLVAALLQQYAGHNWPIVTARYKLKMLQEHLTQLNTTGTYDDEIQKITDYLLLIENGKVPFN